METSQCISYYKLFYSDSLRFVYQGEFSDRITDKVIQLNENELNQKDDFAILNKRVSFVMAECFQNIIRHFFDFFILRYFLIETY